MQIIAKSGQTFATCLIRIYAEPFASNRASARVLEKAGFVCEGRLRARIFKDSKQLDSFLYARVRDTD